MTIAVQAERVIRMRDGRVLQDRPVTDALRRELLGGATAVEARLVANSEPPASEAVSQHAPAVVARPARAVKVS
jgi:hypothetical protein